MFEYESSVTHSIIWSRLSGLSSLRTTRVLKNSWKISIFDDFIRDCKGKLWTFLPSSSRKIFSFRGVFIRFFNSSSLISMSQDLLIRLKIE